MPEPIHPDFFLKLTSVLTPSLSPNGDMLAFARSHVDHDEMKTHNSIAMLKLPDQESRSFTAGPSDTNPKFSPDGKSVSFLRPDGDDVAQIWIIPVAGGEARQVTTGPAAATEHAWSPDSRSLAFVANVDPDRLPPDHDHENHPRVRIARRIRYRHDQRGWVGDSFNQLFVVEAASGETRQLTEGEGDCSVPVWSPAGDRIAYISDEVEERDFNNDSEARVIPAVGGTPTAWSAGLHRVWALAWSPDGTRLAACGTHDPIMWDPRETSIYLLEAGRDCRNLTDGAYTSDPSSAEVRWLAEGIWFIGDRHGQSFLCRVDEEGGIVTEVGGPVKYSGGWAIDADATRAALIEVTAAAIDNLVLFDRSTGTRNQVTDFNRSYLEAHPPAAMEKFTIERGGQQIECRVLHPPDFDPGQRYPMVVDIHGGPHSRFSDWFDPYQQIIATAGYVVLGVNPRGSSSYGLDFAKMVLGDWGGEDFLDIMAGVDALCERDYVDADRLAVHGASYGGYMGSWIIGHDHRFKAAVVGAPCTNLHSMYGTSDIGVSFFEMNWRGTPLELRDALLAHSPISYVENVTTPVLLYHGENDLRCPIEQSEQYFVALLRLGREVEFLRYPDSPHGFRRSAHPALRTDCSRRILDWLEKHV